MLTASRHPDADARYATMGLNPEAAAAKRAFELPVLLAAMAVVPVFVIEEEAASFEWQVMAYVANWAIWGGVRARVGRGADAHRPPLALPAGRLARSAHRHRVLPGAAAPAGGEPTRPPVRLAPALLVLKAVRLAALVTRAGHSFRSLFRQHGLGYVLTVSGLIALAFGALFAMIEPEADSVADGLWWAIVTVTTVGYGDIYPATVPGRLAGVALMVLGIGFVAILTAAIAARFIEDDVDALGIATPERIAERLDSFQVQLDRLEATLEEVRRRSAG